MILDKWNIFSQDILNLVLLQTEKLYGCGVVLRSSLCTVPAVPSPSAKTLWRAFLFRSLRRYCRGEVGTSWQLFISSTSGS